MKVILIFVIGVLCFTETEVCALSPIYSVREQEFRTIRRNCIRCIAEADEYINMDQLTALHALHSQDRKQMKKQLISNLIESDNIIRACIIVDEYKLKMELKKPFFEHDNGYCWLLDAQLSFYNSMRILIQSYIQRVRAHFRRYRSSCMVRPFRRFP